MSKVTRLTEEEIQNWTATHLRKELKKRKLGTNGKKSELVRQKGYCHIWRAVQQLQMQKTLLFLSLFHSYTLSHVSLRSCYYCFSLTYQFFCADVDSSACYRKFAHQQQLSNNRQRLNELGVTVFLIVVPECVTIVHFLFICLNISFMHFSFSTINPQNTQ